jgi:hypothetical protein
VLGVAGKPILAYASNASPVTLLTTVSKPTLFGKSNMYFFKIYIFRKTRVSQLLCFIHSIGHTHHFSRDHRARERPIFGQVELVTVHRAWWGLNVSDQKVENPGGRRSSSGAPPSKVLKGHQSLVHAELGAQSAGQELGDFLAVLWQPRKHLGPSKIQPILAEQVQIPLALLLAHTFYIQSSLYSFQL